MAALPKLQPEELDFIELFYCPEALAECLFSNFDNTSQFEDKHSEIRIGQFPLLSYDCMLDYDESKSEKENFRLKEGAGQCYVLGGRRFGKSLCVEIIDILLSTLLLENEDIAFTSLDALHIRGILEKIIVGLENHPILKQLKAKINRSPSYRIFIERNGWLLESVNMALSSKDPGSQWFQKHKTRTYVEEASFETDEVYNKRIDAISELGCVVRAAGMTNFTKYSPSGRTFFDMTKKPWVMNIPQTINPRWDKKQKKKAIKEYGGENCFDSETEILTKRGWKKYNEITLEDRVLSLNLENNKASYEEIKQIFVYDYKDNINLIDKENAHFCFTDKHRLVCHTIKNTKNRFKTVEDFLNRKIEYQERKTEKTDVCLECGKKLQPIKKQKYFCSRACRNKFYKYIQYPNEKLYIPRTFEWEGKNVDNEIVKIGKNSTNSFSYEFLLDDWLKFLGWFISEGCVYKHNRKKYSEYDYDVYRVQISQSKLANPDFHKEIYELMKRMNLSVSDKHDNFIFTSEAVGKYLLENCGYLSHNKKVPDFVKELPKEKILLLLDTYFKGDGRFNENYYRSAATTSKQLADDIQELIFKVGGWATVREEKIEKENYHDLYHVTWNNSDGRIIVHQEDVKKVPYEGKIWCVETPKYNTLFIRKKGKCCWTGNSIQYRIFVEGKVVEDGLSVMDMVRVRKCYKENETIKHFEITKENYENFKYILNVERPKNAEMIYIAADIGETAPTEIIIMSLVTNGDIRKYHYLYNITVYNLAAKEQEIIFKHLGDLLEANIIALDTTDGEGRAIFRALELVYPKENMVWVGFNEKTPIGVAKTEQGYPMYKDGKPVFEEEYVSEWTMKRLKGLLYDEKMLLPIDYKLDVQLNSIISTQSGTRTVYSVVSEEDHLLAAFRVFALAEWEKEFATVRSIRKKVFCKN